MGMDVCHGNTADDTSSGSRSVAALTCTLDPYFNRYYKALRNQKKTKELVLDIGSMVEECLKMFKKLNKDTLPTHIIFYRDGVGEGMYSDVLDIEYAAMEETFKILYENQEKPKVTLLVVQKRNHFRGKVEEADGNQYNPPAGTLVDEAVVDAARSNFYLYSHSTNQGTAKPTHYQVLKNSINLKLEQIVDITFALSHLHQACTNSISIPAPVFYADRTCGRAVDYYEGADQIPPSIQNGM